MSDKCYIAGSGIVGCVLAHELAEKGYDVFIFERRKHTGGNLYDFTDEHGIHVHLYGPHIFHTDNKKIFEYVSRFCELRNYNLVCGSMIDGKCVKTSFDFSAIDIFFPQEAKTIKEHIQNVFGDKKSATILEMLNSEDMYVLKFARFLYEKDYKLYTAKQWGISPDKVDKQVFQRVPVLFSYGSKYFDDTYQALPVSGYMQLIDNLLKSENIHVETGVDALSHFKILDNRIYMDGKPFKDMLIYTGPIDELFECKYGKLPYRSLRFEWKYEEIESFQELPVVAYPQAKDFTRITEYKKLPNQNVEGTTYAVEYPLPYKNNDKNEPYYPVITEESKELFAKYKARAEEIKNLVCGGRLADFKYYNMDQAIHKALELVKTID